ncbi:carbonic anhydrase [Halomonas stenophila]|uniref:Carbonic anhydrase n=1 Tax=Halomonas stenophila TaxID=795312 RepID=A0A7W5HMU1_9GAMM|nr:carbonic anhydrase family protein [Halomonas stenophila]MBB3232989.1 carbonic anhydrase [Halomonas stenophila]
MIRRHLAVSAVALVSALITIPAVASDGASWSYTADRGPGHWAELSPDYAACGAGHNQSPVDIATSLETSLGGPSIEYPHAGYQVRHDGHTVKVTFPPGNAIEYEGKRYRLRQLHFHAPSEHHLNGQAFPMEAHLVHEAGDGRLAVLALLFEEGQAEPALETLLRQAPATSGQQVTLDAGLEADALLPDAADYYRLNGSLTTPPCSEGVLWLVAKAPLSASETQLQAMSRLLGEANNRPLQPLNARRVLE